MVACKSESLTGPQAAPPQVITNLTCLFWTCYAVWCALPQCITAWHSSLFATAEQRWNSSYTVPYAPPEIVKMHKGIKGAVCGTAHDMWAFGAMFEQVLAATCQSGSLFLPDASAVAAEAPEQRVDALHAAVAAAQDSWVCRHKNALRVVVEKHSPMQLQHNVMGRSTAKQNIT